MTFIKTFAGILMVIFVMFFLGITIKYKHTYAQYTAVFSNKNNKLKIFLPFGLYVLDRSNYSFNSQYDRKYLNKLSELYGQGYSAFFIRVFYSRKIILTALLVLCELFCIFLGLEGLYSVYLLGLIGLIILSDDIKLNNKIKVRRLMIQLEFPNFINKLTLLLNAGLTMSKSWEKISADADTNNEFYSEVEKTISEIRSGKNEAEAFSDFAKRVKTPEIQRLMSLIIQNTKKGGSNLVLSLRLQSNECWEMRKNTIRRLGEEASTKLLFPMIIMFFAIIIIVVAPAIISMQGISNF